MVFIKGSRLTLPIRKLISNLALNKIDSIPNIIPENFDQYVAKYCQNANKSNYYNNLFNQVGMPQNIYEFQETMPIITRDILEKNTINFLNKDYPINKLTQTHTSGTSGNPLYLYKSNNEMCIVQRDYNLLKNLGMKNTDDMLVVASGGSSIMEAAKKYTFLFPNMVHADKKGMQENINYLQKFKLVKSYTRFLLNFLKTNNFKKNPFTNLETLILMGEILTDKTKNEYYEYLNNIELVNLFACVEFGYVAQSCEHGFFHPFNGFYIESLKTESGLEELVITDFKNNKPGQFITRYATGDSIIMNDMCPCGKEGQSFSVLGRVSEQEMSKHLNKTEYNDMITDLLKKHNLPAYLVGINIKDLGYTIKIIPELVVKKGFEKKLKNSISANEINKKFLSGQYPNLYIEIGVWTSGNPKILQEEPEGYIGKIRIKNEV